MWAKPAGEAPYDEAKAEEMPAVAASPAEQAMEEAKAVVKLAGILASSGGRACACRVGT